MIQRKTILTAVLFLATTLGCFASIPKGSELSGLCIDGVKTTAYSNGADDNGAYGPRNALGKPLKSGRVASAAADWSHYPVGTRFRIVDTGQEYVVDDYGSALVGTGTIDLYKTSDAQVNHWGVRHVTIEILEWGSPEKSLRILKDRGQMRHIREMVQALRDQRAA